MAKRRNVVVLSDDDEDPPAPSRKPPLLPDRGPVYASKRTHPGSRKQSEKCRLEDIGAGKCKYQQPNTQLWVDKYRPKSLSDLAVHSKKIAEVRAWLEAKLHCVDKLHAGSCVLVLAGPTGVGKTTVVRVLVDLLEAELCEWETPVPTLWKDYLHLVNTGVPYISKLKEFEEFLESVKKYPLLPLLPTLPQGIDKPLVQGPRSCGKPKVLLLDDLPAVHGRESASQLCYCLHNFALSVRFPTIVIVTDVLETGENGEGTSRVMAEIQQALESGGALKVFFNPITANSIRKVLTKISSAKKCPVSSESLSFIAESCGGDIRHAIYCLQFLSLCENPTQCTWDPGGVRYTLQKLKRRRVSEVANRKREASQSPDPIVSSCCTSEDSRPIACRDGVLSLFHALGKLLHNKRHTEAAKDSGLLVSVKEDSFEVYFGTLM